jgi:hypothetical protein
MFLLGILETVLNFFNHVCKSTNACGMKVGGNKSLWGRGQGKRMNKSAAEQMGRMNFGRKYTTTRLHRLCA